MSLNHQKYHDFTTLLEQLRSELIANQLDTPQLRKYTTSLQQFFQQQVVPLAEEVTDSATQRHVQSYQTEMSKQMRLLEIDVMFFQAARQASTMQVRVDALLNRLGILIDYCNAIVQPQGDQGKSEDTK